MQARDAADNILNTGGQTVLIMKHVYNRLLRDDESRAHLERGDSIAFEGSAREWQEIERQVERLGFGDQYTVSRTKRPAPAGEHAVTRVTPLHPRPQP